MLLLGQTSIISITIIFIRFGFKVFLACSTVRKPSFKISAQIRTIESLSHSISKYKGLLSPITILPETWHPIGSPMIMAYHFFSLTFLLNVQILNFFSKIVSTNSYLTYLKFLYYLLLIYTCGIKMIIFGISFHAI